MILITTDPLLQVVPHEVAGTYCLLHWNRTRSAKYISLDHDGDVIFMTVKQAAFSRLLAVK